MEKVQVVKRGDCAWNFAKRNLKEENKKVSNAAIVEEMNRLARLNGCDSVKDFSKKFFSSVGKEIKTSGEEAVERQESAPAKNNPFVSPTPTEPTATEPREPLQPAAPVKTPEKNKINILTELRKKLDAAAQKLNERAAAKAEEAARAVAARAEVAKAEEVAKINGLKDDVSRIVEYNKNNYNGEYYGIVDKKKGKLKIYNKEGKVVKTIKVAMGKNKGDDISYGYMSDDKSKKEAGRYTTPGEFTLDEYKYCNNNNYVSRKDGKIKFMALKGDNRGDESAQPGIHMVPNNRLNDRVDENGNLKGNRLSYGCVNLTEKDYDKMHEYLGEGDKIYILPEEEGNELTLNRQEDGSYKFEQQYHKDQKRDLSKEDASRVRYDVRPGRAPEAYA